MDDGQIEFFKGERHQDDGVGTGTNGQADVHNVCVGMSHKLGNISDSHCVALTSVPSLITTQCLNFEAFFETLKQFSGIFLMRLSLWLCRVVPPPSRARLLNLDLYLGHIYGADTSFRQWTRYI